jgi:small subunit ribosomal protein YMR-31
MSGAQLGPVEPPAGYFFDRTELGSKYHRIPLTAAEIEAVESGGATLFG